MSFLEENEVIVVAREKSDQFGTAGGRKTAGIPLKKLKACHWREEGSCRRRNGRRLLIAEPVVMNYGIFQGFNEVSNSANGAFTLDI